MVNTFRFSSLSFFPRFWPSYLSVYASYIHPYVRREILYRNSPARGPPGHFLYYKRAFTDFDLPRNTFNDFCLAVHFTVFFCRIIRHKNYLLTYIIILSWRFRNDKGCTKLMFQSPPSSKRSTSILNCTYVQKNVFLLRETSRFDGSCKMTNVYQRRIRLTYSLAIFLQTPFHYYS